jgi:hypothetical protein
MSSSRTTAHLPAALADASGSRLLDLLKTVADPRARRGRRHSLASVLAVGLAAVIGGARSFVAIGEWVAHQPIETLRILGVTGLAVPDESTIRRVFAPGSRQSRGGSCGEQREGTAFVGGVMS